MKKTIIKNISYLLFVFAGMFLMQSCTDEIPRVLEGKVLSLETKSLSLSANSVYFDSYENSSRSVTVRAENMEWEFTDIPEWLSVSPASGVGETDVRIEVSENPNAVNRVGLLTFRSVGGAWNYSMAFTVSQFRAPYSISLPVDTLQVLSESTTRTVQVDVNTDTWSIIIPESMDWCTARKAEGGMVITVDENKAAYSRKGVVELHTDDVSAYLTVTQHPSGVKSINDGVGFPVEGGSQSMGVNVGASWSIETTYSWIDVKTLSGDAGFANIPIEVTPNYDLKSRDGFIYIVIAQDNKIAVPVHQEGIAFSVDKSILVPSVDYTTRLNIKSNMPWRFCVDSIPDWITVDPASGSGNTQAIVKIKSNRVMRSRSASLPIDIMSLDGGSVLGHTSVEVIQDAFTFGADASALYFSDVAGSTMFNIKSDGNWFAHSSASWITVSPDEGDKSSPVNVSVTENTDSTARFGSVILRTSGRRDTVPVYQAGKFIDVSSKALSFQSNRDSVAVNLTANGHWTASPSASWIKLSESEGGGDCDISIKALDNPSSESRTAEVILSRDGYNPLRISVSQAGRYLTLSSGNIVFFDKGGTSEPVTVQTDGTWDVYAPDWITVNRESESQFTISVPENTGSNTWSGSVVVTMTDLVSGTLQRTITVLQGAHFEAEYVDLGLSVYWATCNVGATTPYEHGGLYAWGELTTKNSYNGWRTYNWCNGSKNTITKYNSNSDYGYDGFVDNKNCLEPYDDVAAMQWGDGWRIPTKDEFFELINSCIWEWVEMGDIEGYIVTSCVPGYTGQSIFLSASGGDWGGGARRTMHGGFYWTSEVATIPAESTNFNFGIDYYGIGDGGNRYVGFSVRPVKNTDRTDSVKISLSRTALCIEEGSMDYLTATVRQYNESSTSNVIFRSSNNNVATVNNYGEINAVSPGTCVISAEYGSVSTECTVHVTQSKPAPQMVDLGLSVKWASFDLGADNPEDVGYYIAWGETGSKSVYDNYTYKFITGSNSNMVNKYCNNSAWGIPDDKLILEAEDDAATAIWGSDWRTPTREEMDELFENCTWTWTTQNGISGYIVTSNVEGYTNNFIFLPAAGGCVDDKQTGVDLFGHYWTSSMSDASYTAAWELYFNYLEPGYHSGSRYNGNTIRPVSNE